MLPMLTKNYIAGGTIARNRAVKFSASGTVVLVGANDANTIGFTRGLIDVVVGDRVDVISQGIVDAVCGGTVARGAALGVDATGAVVAYASGRGIGRALESGVSGDWIPVELNMGEAA